MIDGIQRRYGGRMADVTTDESTHYLPLEALQNALRAHLSGLKDVGSRVVALNALRSTIHEYSPFADEPVDCVLWVLAEDIRASDYNPNVMAPPEKRLLQHSLLMDGFTQPVVVSPDNEGYEVVDGFHRFLMGSTNSELKKRLANYLPVTQVQCSRRGKSDRVASTIRHNRARGQHQITAMSDIVRDLSRLGWDDEKVALELGMDADEVLRLKQISGLSELFSNTEFSSAWTVE